MRLAEALRQQLPEPEYETLVELVRDVPSIRELAEIWSGQSSGRAYLNARRRFERYLAGLGQSRRGGRQTRAPRDLEEFLDQFRVRIERERRRLKSKGLVGEIKGEVQVSKDTRERSLRFELDGDTVDRILDALDEGDEDAAAEIFEDEVGSQNGFGATPHWLDVEELAVR